MKVELVGGAVEQCRDGGALGRGLSFRNVILNKWPLSLLKAALKQHDVDRHS